MEKTISKEEKQQLCEQLVDKPLQVLTQFDGFAKLKGLDVLDPDEHGFAVTGGKAEELFNGAWDMRLFIKPETSRNNALALLDRMRDWIARSHEWPMFEYNRRDRPSLAIQVTPAGDSDCALCAGGFRCELDGPGLVVAGTGEPVCYSCGRKHAPILEHALEVYWADWATKAGYPTRTTARNDADETSLLPADAFPSLAIQFLPTCRKPCRLCPAAVSHDSGPGLVVAGTESLVHGNCACRYAPGLVAMLEAYRPEHQYPPRPNAPNGADNADEPRLMPDDDLSF
jgi:hypothetical protein